MYKKTIKYNDYNGTVRSEDHYFNLEEAELVKLQMGIKGGFAEMMQQAIRNEDSPVLLDAIERLIRMSYGIKDIDGKRFRKSEEIFEAFQQTPAYSVLFMELLTDDNASNEFVRNVIPTALAEKLPENIKDGLPEDIKATITANN